VKLVACGLAFGYAGEPIGWDVDLALEDGEVLCLLGPNGSGKTTLFKTLLGLLKAQGGEITLDGVPLAHWSRWQLAQVMAYVPQAAAGYFPFTVLETVLMGRTARLGLFAIPSRRDRLAAEAALTALGINNLQNHIFTRLSGGQRQLTLIARALAQEPRILVMDEPTASLDFGNQIRVLDHIRALARRNIGIVLATHDPDHALTCADRVALLRQGRLIGYGPPADAITSASLWALYGVAVDVVTLPGSQRKICAPGLSAIPPVSRLTGVTR
jgi:iron complex transport system ATP-binding protein